MFSVAVRVQYRHLHVSQKDADVLFGEGYRFSSLHRLEHHGQHVYEETVTVVGERGMLERVHVLGPVREQTQLEISAADAFAAGIDAPVRVSGELGRSAAVVELRGPAGVVRRKCAIIPVRHLHLSDTSAKKLGLAHHDTVSVETTEGVRIPHVIVRVHPTYGNSFHLTSDEAATYWIESGSSVRIIS